MGERCAEGKRTGRCRQIQTDEKRGPISVSLSRLHGNILKEVKGWRGIKGEEKGE